MNKKLWGGRFNASTNSQVEAFTASIHFDAALINEDILGSIAHAAMLEKCNILSKEEYLQIKNGLLEILQQHHQQELIFNLADEDIHMNIERLLHEKIGDVAGKLHTARSRNDQVALDLHLFLRKETIELIELMLQLQQALIAAAEKYKNVILPGYTHLQRAQPIYLGSHLLSYVAMLQRDIARLQDAWNRINQCPLGAGALAGSSFLLDKEYTAQLLGFDGIYFNSIDAVSDRDFAIELLSNIAISMMHLSRLSEEIILWSTQEFNFINLADEFCTGSSIMPQKKNPDIAELTRGKTGRVYGSLVNLLTIFKGLPLAYNRDMQEDKEPIFDSINTCKACLAIFSPLIKTMSVNTEVMLQATAEGFINATALAEYLVKKGITFRKSHEIVGNIVKYCTQQQCKIEDLSLDQLQNFSTLITADIQSVLTVENVAANQDRGNIAKSSRLENELQQRHHEIISTQAWLSEKELLLHSVNEDVLS